LLGVNRSRVYYDHVPQSEFNLQLMDLIDRQYTEHPTTGVLGMVDHIALKHKAIVNPKRVRRLMRTMSLMAVYPKPRTTLPNIKHKVFPCLLGRLKIIKPCQVWCTDITYIRLLGGLTPGMIYGGDADLWSELNLSLSSKAAGPSRLLRRLTASHGVVKADADATKQTGLISQQY
jgi:hypothetical protein